MMESFLRFLGQRLKIGNELLKLSRIDGNTLIVTRGIEWTQKEDHKAGSRLYSYKKVGQILRLQEILPEFKVVKYTDAYISGIKPISRETRADQAGYVDLSDPVRTGIITIELSKGEYKRGDVIRIGREMFLVKNVNHRKKHLIQLEVQRGYDGTNQLYIQHNPPVGDVYKLINYESYYTGFKNDPTEKKNYYWDYFANTLDKVIKNGNAIPWIIVYSPVYATQARGKVAKLETIRNPGDIKNNVIVDEYNSLHADADWWFRIHQGNDEKNDLAIAGNMYQFYHAELHILTGKAAGKVFYIRSHSGERLRVVKALEDSYWTDKNPEYVDLVKEGVKPGDVYKITHASNRVGNVAPKYWQYNADLFYMIASYINTNYSTDLLTRPFYMEYYLEPNLGSYGTWTKEAYIASYNVFANTIRNGGVHFSKGFSTHEVMVGAGAIAGGLNPVNKINGSSSDYELALSLIDDSPVLDFISHHRYYMGSRIQKRENSWEYWMLKNYAQGKGKDILIIDSEDSVATAGGKGKEEARHWAQFSIPYWGANFINSYYGDFGESGRLDFIIHFRLYYANDQGLGIAAADSQGKPLLDIVYWPLKLYRDHTSSDPDYPDTLVKVIQGSDTYGWIQSMGTVHGQTGEKKVHIINKKGTPITIKLALTGAGSRQGIMESIIGGVKIKQ